MVGLMPCPQCRTAVPVLTVGKATSTTCYRCGSVLRWTARHGLTCDMSHPLTYEYEVWCMESGNLLGVYSTREQAELETSLDPTLEIIPVPVDPDD